MITRNKLSMKHSFWIVLENNISFERFIENSWYKMEKFCTECKILDPEVRGLYPNTSSLTSVTFGWIQSYQVTSTTHGRLHLLLLLVPVRYRHNIHKSEVRMCQWTSEFSRNNWHVEMWFVIVYHTEILLFHFLKFYGTPTLLIILSHSINSDQIYICIIFCNTNGRFLYNPYHFSVNGRPYNSIFAVDIDLRNNR